MQLLEEARSLHVPALRQAVDRLIEPLKTIAGYQLGWVDARGRPASGSEGKTVRLALVMLSAQAVGAAPASSVPGGVAIELVHNFSLLHDDFMDQDVTRRHRPAAWVVFGAAQAILAGDALQALAADALLNLPASCVTESSRARASTRLSDAVCHLIGGQARDLAYERRDLISVQECLEMEAGKTSALLACASSMGAVLAGASDATVEPLGRYGHHLGLAFQAVDDLLDIWGDPAVTGKPIWGDLRRGKKSLPVCFALNEGGAASEQLTELLTGPQPADLDEEQLALRAFLIEKAGGRAWANNEAQYHHESALAALRELEAMPEKVHEHLVALTKFVIHRNW
ncbi:polyprenyl synthetase family protein [Streptomyces sp. NPDC060085]|uniref:polyprenyl synthetase family protein n=1 Tax=Streptomyces sp. NPDC060085 TaxID=3347054 RepID=UPI003661AD26